MADNIIAFNSSGVWQISVVAHARPDPGEERRLRQHGRRELQLHQPVSAGATDISLDPLFVSRASSDFRLQATSPCKDAGDNAYVPSTLTADLDGNPRIIDGDGDATAVVDMGTYEFTSGTDTTAPTVTITAPTGNASFVTSLAVIDLAGTASDNVGITGVTWSNDRGGSGSCDGTTSWTASGILLFIGQNVITVTARDHASGGNTGTDIITVTYSLPVTISGYVRTAGGSAISGVILDGLPSTPSTDATGYYSDTAVPSGWSGTVTPLKIRLVLHAAVADLRGRHLSTKWIRTYTGTGGFVQPTVTTTVASSRHVHDRRERRRRHFGRRSGGHGAGRLLGLRAQSDDLQQPYEDGTGTGSFREQHHRPDGGIHLLRQGLRHELDRHELRERDQLYDCRQRTTPFRSMRPSCPPRVRRIGPSRLTATASKTNGSSG